MPNRWVGMGHEVAVTRVARRFRDRPKLAGRLDALEYKVENLRNQRVNQATERIRATEPERPGSRP